LSTMYLDKPMKNHTLMQTIARANRVFRDKTNGLIVDYIGVFRDLQKALAIYGSASGGGIKEGETPVKPKSELIKELAGAIAETESLCKENGIDISKIIRADKLKKIKFITETVDTLLSKEELKKRYLLLSANVKKLYKAILPDTEAGKYIEIYTVFNIIADRIREESPEVDISEVMGKVESLLDESIETKGYVIKDLVESYTDLSKIDFEALKRHFIEGVKHIQAEKLKRAIRNKVNKLIRLNRARVNLMEKFQQMIDEYNSGAVNVEVFFDRLLAFAGELNDEEKRGISENLSEEELAVFDLLNKPDLTDKEKREVKFAAKNILEVLKREKLVLDWRKRQQTRADVLLTIRTILDKELPRSYAPDLFQQKCDFLYQHIYDSYYGAGKGIY
ncbi:MAG: type I restriction enzyme endonuclease domain-containing protein, partial [Nitrospinota bacterium]